jgi:hypothetical protein
VSEIKKLLEKSSYRDQEELDAEKKQTLIENTTSEKRMRIEIERVNKARC